MLPIAPFLKIRSAKLPGRRLLTRTVHAVSSPAPRRAPFRAAESAEGVARSPD